MTLARTSARGRDRPYSSTVRTGAIASVDLTASATTKSAATCQPEARAGSSHAHVVTCTAHARHAAWSWVGLGWVCGYDHEPTHAVC